MRQLNFCTEIYVKKNSNSNITNIKDIHLQKLVKKSSFPNIKKMGWTNLNLIGFFNVPSIVMHLLAIKEKMLEY